RDRSRARAAVGLEHVAVDRDLAFAEALEIDRGAERASDETLDLLRAPARRLAASVAALASLAVCTRMHLILRRDPALALSFHPGRDLGLDRRRAKDDRMARAVEDGSLRVPLETDRHLYGPEHVRRAPIGTLRHGRRDITPILFAGST